MAGPRERTIARVIDRSYLGARDRSRLLTARANIMEPLTLEGRHVRLEPLEPHHADALSAVGFDLRIWEFSRTLLQSPADVAQYIARALAARDAGTALPFVTMDRESGQVIGSTRFENMDLAERRVEVGWSWLNPRWWRTAINTESKYLMIRHAFEQWKCVRVEFRVHVANERSLASIQRVGATLEGVLRRRLLYRDGSFRDLVYLSIVEDEWPTIRRRLEERLAATRKGSAA